MTAPAKAPGKAVRAVSSAPPPAPLTLDEVLSEAASAATAALRRYATTLALIEASRYGLDVVDAYAASRGPVDEMEELVGNAKSTRKHMGENRIPQFFEDTGITTVTRNGYRVTVGNRMVASIVASEKEAAMEWLRKNGHEDLIKPTVNASTLSAAAKFEIVDKNKDFPDDLFFVMPVPTTSVTKVAAKK